MKRSCWDFYPGTGEPKGHCHESSFCITFGIGSILRAVNIFWGKKMFPLAFYYTDICPVCEVDNLQIKNNNCVIVTNHSQALEGQIIVSYLSITSLTNSTVNSTVQKFWN